jgi:programmed cell death 6-interacting protein
VSKWFLSFYRYYRALSLVETRFPISKDHGDVNVSFTWYDAFKASKRTEQFSVHFEKASILFNIGAVVTQQALAADRSTDAGLKDASKKFQVTENEFQEGTHYHRHSGLLTCTSLERNLHNASLQSKGMAEEIFVVQAISLYHQHVDLVMPLLHARLLANCFLEFMPHTTRLGTCFWCYALLAALCDSLKTFSFQMAAKPSSCQPNLY